MVLLIKELVGNRSFPLKADGNKRNRLRRLKNDVPQGSVLAPLLFNIYTSDLPIIVTRKYAHADDLAIMHEGGRQWMSAQRRIELTTPDLEVQHYKNSVGRSPMECGVVGGQYETPCFHSQHRHSPS